MSGFNRLMTVLLFLSALVAAIVAILVATEVSDPDFLFGGWFGSELEWIAGSEGEAVAIIIAISIASALLLITLILIEIIEIMPHRASVQILMKSVSSEAGIATLDNDSVCKLAETMALNTSNVQNAKCSTKSGPEGMIISCAARVSIGTNIPALSTELQRKIRTAVEDLTGFSVAMVNVSSKYESGNHKRTSLLE